MGSSERVDEAEFKRKTFSLGLACIRLVRSMKRDMVGEVIGRQIVRCGTSVGANYRAACRAKSRPDMIAKLGIVEEEGDEVLYWLEMLVASETVESADVRAIMAEAESILRLTVASLRTLRSNPKPKS